MDNSATNTFFKDKQMVCIDCNKSFIWTGGEQRFYTNKGFTPPKRCLICRGNKKAMMASKRMSDTNLPGPTAQEMPENI
jgi:hypothetical protein